MQYERKTKIVGAVPRRSRSRTVSKAFEPARREVSELKRIASGRPRDRDPIPPRQQ